MQHKGKNKVKGLLQALRRAIGDPGEYWSPPDKFTPHVVWGNNVERKHPFHDSTLPVEERIDNALSLLNLKEKIVCLGSRNHYISRLGLPLAGQTEGYHGAAMGGPFHWAKGDGGTDVPTTQFCQAIGLAATWEPELVYKVAEVEASEFRYIYHKMLRGGLIVRSPNADIGRDIRWGRTEECYGEDPYLNARFSVAFVQGLQGDHPRYWRTAALLKHFLANSNENNRSCSSSDFDESLFREYYSYAFYKAFTEGGSKCYMTAYNSYNGVPCHVHPVLKQITRDQWDVDGIICTDGGGLGLLVTDQQAFPDLAQAAAACLKAGISQFLDEEYPEGVVGALEQGLVDEGDIDAVLRGNFRVMIRLGLWDPPESVPYTRVGETKPWQKPEQHQLVREVTRKSIVLLENRNRILPLRRDCLNSLAVIGHQAQAVYLDWYSGTPPYWITPLKGIMASAGSKLHVAFDSGNRPDEAVTLARKTDAVVFFAGNHPVCYNLPWGESLFPSEGREAVDRKTITLEPRVLEVIEAVAAVNPNTVLVLLSSFPYALGDLREKVPSILHMTHNSQETGSALADVLFGDYNPAGRLVQTWPRSLEQLPELLDYNIRNNRTYMYFQGEEQYAFGYGLSYTSFAYRKMEFSRSEIKAEGCLEVTIQVQNTGVVDGEEVVQLYVRYPVSRLDRPVRALKGFQRIFIPAGKVCSLQLTLKGEDLAHWDAESQSWAVEAGPVEILVGGSSRLEDLVLRGIIRLSI